MIQSFGVLPEAAASPHRRSEGNCIVPLAKDGATREMNNIVRDLAALPGFARKLVDALSEC